MDDLMVDILPFLAIETAVLILLIFFPDIVLIPLRFMMG